MPLPTYYAVGTASVTNGATAITFSGALLGTADQPNLIAGDLFLDPAQPLVPPQRITAIDYDAVTAALAAAWPGTTMTDDAYEVRFVGDIVRSTAQNRRILEQLSVVQANGRGLFYRFDDTVTDADPGAGLLRLNHATIASATAGFLDNLDADGATVSAVIDTWDDNPAAGKGQLWLRAIADPASFHAFDVTGSVVDGTGYRKLTLTYVGGSGSFADGDELMVMFSPAGQAGLDGPTGADGGITMIFGNPTAAADPGAGKFRLNHATHASATALYIDNAEALGGGNIGPLVDTWDDSTATMKGQLQIVNQDAPANWRIYQVTGSVVDSTGYRTVTIAYVAGNGTLADETTCSLFFTRTGNNGIDGLNGTNGITAGLRYLFSTTTTDSDPGAGNLRLNHATPGSATAAFLDNLDSDGATVTGTLDTWDDSTSTVRGVLTIRSAATPATFRQYNVTGSVVDGTGYRKLTLVHLAGNGTFGNGDAVAVQFARSGNDGAAGFPDVDRRNQLLAMANGAKSLAAYQRFLDTVAFGYKTSGDLDASSTGCSVDTTLGCVKPAVSGGGAYGPSGGSGGATGNSAGTIGGNGKTPDGFGGGGSGGALGSTTPGSGAPGAPGLIVAIYTTSPGGITKTIAITSGSSWVVPADWNSANNSIHALGAGGPGGNASTSASGGGGQGGCYSGITNLALTPGATVTIQIGTSVVGSDGGDTWFNGANLAASSVGAKGGKMGTNASGGTAGAGGTGNTAAMGVGTTKYAGGSGSGATGLPNGYGSGPGGGSAGPHGNGGNGGTGAGGTNGAGAGGGANSGSNGGAFGSAVGGTGGNGRLGTGGGVAGSPGGDATPGTGAGGAGSSYAGSGNLTAASVSGGKGAQEDLWTGTGTTQNGVAIDPYQTADAARTKVRGTFEIDPVDAITLGTDWTVEYTCNGGTNWHAAATYTNCGKGQSGRTVVETDEVSCTSGTSWSSRKKNLNNKDVRVHKTITKAAA